VLQRHETPAVIAKRLSDSEEEERERWVRQRNILIVAPGPSMGGRAGRAAGFYGFRPHSGWDDTRR
jgi:hypothetical protein